MKKTTLLLSLLAFGLCTFISARFDLALGLLLLTVFACAVNKRIAVRFCDVTLSVPELLSDVLDAFKLETPELFAPGGFSKDFSSKTAVLGDSITAHISHLPTVADYDAAQGGFKNGATAVKDLIEDVSVTIDRLVHVPVKIPYLTSLRTKGVDLYKAALSNVAYALGKNVVDGVLAQAASGGCVTNSILGLPSYFNLDYVDDTLRAQCNAQKMAQQTRWGFISTALASTLGLDDRVRSSLFYGKLNGENGYRVWKNIGGFQWLREYPDVINAGNNLGGVFGDHRLAVVSVRKIEDMENAAKSFGIREVMRFYPMRDEQTGLELCGISFQEAGTGQVHLSVALLFGVGVGNQFGSPGTKTDNAGLLVQTA